MIKPHEQLATLFIVSLISDFEVYFLLRPEHGIWQWLILLCPFRTQVLSVEYSDWPYLTLFREILDPEPPLTSREQRQKKGSVCLCIWAQGSLRAAQSEIQMAHVPLREVWKQLRRVIWRRLLVRIQEQWCNS